MKGSVLSVILIFPLNTLLNVHSYFSRFATKRKNTRVLRKSGGVSGDVIVNATDDTTGEKEERRIKIDDAVK